MTFEIKISEDEVKEVLEQHIRGKLMSNFKITRVKKVSYEDFYKIEGDNIPQTIQNSAGGFLAEEQPIPITPNTFVPVQQ